MEPFSACKWINNVASNNDRNIFKEFSVLNMSVNHILRWENPVDELKTILLKNYFIKKLFY